MIYGQDIKLDETLQPVIAANGEFRFTEGPETVVQDIRLHLWTGREGLFYDPNWKAYVIDFVKDESTPGNRLGLVAEVTKRINEDPRVVPMSATCKIAAWDHTGIILHAAFNLIDEDHPYNIIMRIGSLTETDGITKIKYNETTLQIAQLRKIIEDNSELRHDR